MLSTQINMFKPLYSYCWYPAVYLYLVPYSVQDIDEIQREFSVKDSERKHTQNTPAGVPKPSIEAGSTLFARTHNTQLLLETTVAMRGNRH